MLIESQTEHNSVQISTFQHIKYLTVTQRLTAVTSDDALI